MQFGAEYYIGLSFFYAVLSILRIKLVFHNNIKYNPKALNG